MEDTELKTIWQAYDAKLEQSKLLYLQSWVINLKTFESLQHHKAEMTLGSLARYKTRVLAFGILWTVYLAVLVLGDWFKHPYFTVSVGAILLFNIITDLIYIRDIVLIKSVTYSESITATQTKLSKLESSALGCASFGCRCRFIQLFSGAAAGYILTGLISGSSLSPLLFYLLLLGFISTGMLLLPISIKNG